MSLKRWTCATDVEVISNNCCWCNKIIIKDEIRTQLGKKIKRLDKYGIWQWTKLDDFILWSKHETNIKMN